MKENILQFFKTEEEADIVNRVLNHLQKITDEEKKEEKKNDIRQIIFWQQSRFLLSLASTS